MRCLTRNSSVLFLFINHRDHCHCFTLIAKYSKTVYSETGHTIAIGQKCVILVLSYNSLISIVRRWLAYLCAVLLLVDVLKQRGVQWLQLQQRLLPSLNLLSARPQSTLVMWCSDVSATCSFVECRSTDAACQSVSPDGAPPSAASRRRLRSDEVQTVGADSFAADAATQTVQLCRQLLQPRVDLDAMTSPDDTTNIVSGDKSVKSNETGTIWTNSVCAIMLTDSSFTNDIL